MTLGGDSKMKRLSVYAALGILAVLMIVAGGCQNAGRAPEAAFDFEPKVGETPLTVAFDASASTGNIVGYTWEFGDGATASGVSASYTFTEAGRHPVTLVVRDGRGREATTEAAVLAHPPTPPPPG